MTPEPNTDNNSITYYKTTRMLRKLGGQEGGGECSDERPFLAFILTFQKKRPTFLNCC